MTTMRFLFPVYLAAALLAVLAPAWGMAPPVPRDKPEPPPQILRNGQGALLAAAFAQAERGRLRSARAAMPDLADTDPQTAKLLSELLTWVGYVNGADATFTTLRHFHETHSDWPRGLTLRRRVEETITSRTPSAAILAWFSDNPPVTARGRLRYAEALFDEGRTAEAVAWLREGWRISRLSRSEERQILRRRGEHLTEADHIARVDYLLWKRARSDAHRMLSYLPEDRKLLAQARIALIGFAWNVDRRIAAVPARLKDNAGLVYDRVYWRRVKGKHESARELLLSAPVNGEEILRPDRWWRERHFQARRALRRGEVQEAYRLAAEHALLDGHRDALDRALDEVDSEAAGDGEAETALPEVDTPDLPRNTRAQIAEAEWLAGWIALRFLGRPVDAIGHFETMYAMVNFPVSLARGAYWAGRAAEALRDPALAERWFAEAARYPTAYYGQLALDRLGGDMAAVAEAAITPDSGLRARFERSRLVRAARLLALIGTDDALRDVVRHLTRRAGSPAEAALAAELGKELDRPDVGVIAAKLAVRDGTVLIDQGYPVIETPVPLDGTRSLVHAIARQESLFDPQAQSHVGALGLMQLMPATANRVARQLRYPYSKQRLLSDPAYNLTLGSHYFETLMRRYDGSPLLALAAYNAGPGNVSRWIREYGDPRGVAADPVDWIELIPYGETRNYVQRVLEAASIYDLRLDVMSRPSLSDYLQRGRRESAADLHPQPRPVIRSGG